MLFKTIQTPGNLRIIIHNRKKNENLSTKKRTKRKKVLINFDKSSIIRAITTIRLLCEANINQSYPEQKEFRPTLFVTFTFKENLKQIEKANKLFGTFNRNLKTFTKTKIRYLAVPEFQQRGAVHYHVLYFNLPYIKNIYDLFNKKWGHGWVIFRKVKQFNPVKYLIKDLTKTFEFPENKKRYFTSRGLNKPIITLSAHPPDLTMYKDLRLNYIKQKEFFDYNYSIEHYVEK